MTPTPAYEFSIEHTQGRVLLRHVVAQYTDFILLVKR
jgi:hypothetical protein